MGLALFSPHDLALQGRQHRQEENSGDLADKVAVASLSIKLIF